MGARDYDAPLVHGRVIPSALAQGLLGESSAMAARAFLLSDDGTTRVPLPLVRGGSVGADAGSLIRRTAELSIVGQWPEQPTGPLTPYGSRVQVQRGVRVASDAVEWMTLMTGPIWETTQERSKVGQGALTIPLKDEMATIVDDEFDTDTASDPAETVGAAVTRLIRETLPAATIHDLTDGASTALCAELDLQKDRGAAVAKLAASVGCEVYAGRGWQEFVLRRVPTLDDLALWTLTVGERGNITTSSRARTRDGTYNRVLVRGVAQGSSGSEDAKPAPYAATVLTVEQDPAAYYGGPLGRRTWTIERAEYDTTAKCAAAAEMWLQRARGRHTTITASSLVNPAAEPGDVVATQVTRDTPRQLLITDSLTFPLSPADAQAWTTRGVEPLPDSTES